MFRIKSLYYNVTKVVVGEEVKLTQWLDHSTWCLQRAAFKSYLTLKYLLLKAATCENNVFFILNVLF